MTAVDLDALDKLREAATPGPWEKLLDTDAEPHICAGNTYVAGAFDDPADAALIVAAVNALPDLLAEARKYRALREAVTGLAEELDSESSKAADMARAMPRTEENVRHHKAATRQARVAAHHASSLRAVVATVDGEQ